MPITRESGNAADLLERMPLRVVLVFDEVRTGVRGMDLVNALEGRLQDCVAFQLALWKVGVLQVGSLQREALRDAATADLILLALRHGTAFSPAGEMWLFEALNQRAGRPGALVLLTDGTLASGSRYAELRDWLAALTRRTGMDFFSVTASGTGAQFPTALTHFARRKRTPKTPRQDAQGGNGGGLGLRVELLPPAPNRTRP